LNKADINNIKAKLYNMSPTFLQVLINNIRFLPGFFSFLISKKGHKHFNSVYSQKKNRYKGYRCFIIGNGPSLKTMDLSFLQNEYTIGLNRIYLLFEELGFKTDFLVSINRLVIEQFSKELSSIDIYKLFNWKYRKHIKISNKTAFSVSRPGVMKEDLSKGFYGFHGTVTNVAIEFAYYLGFDEIILIGIDHNWKNKGDPDKQIKSDKNDSDHFHPDYFGKGVKWEVPNYKKMEHGYDIANKFISSQNKIIVDATVNGNLKIFKRVKLESYLSNSNYKNKILVK